ncbi:MAG: ydcP, partial [Deltaproteobacteria bacterium]|nr:ydcP [Deltaproteobacteria bacterium]
MERCPERFTPHGAPAMRRPEILAPAGDRDALAAALAAGADAVYFGLDDGFNARARATNFSSDALAEIVAWVHRAGARAYVTLNTLIFEPELVVVEQLVRRIAAAGIDAIIVQDPAVALIARAVCSGLEVHASTQMTASSPLAAELLRGLGLTRVVVPRELSVAEIGAYAAGTSLPLEVFIHGALCVAWSGQCLSSEAWGGRSANRGQCAQACRLPYDLVLDDEPQDLGEVEYLLSPKDLVGLDAVPALAALGVVSLKIEGRLKGPSYVATTVAQYRRATFEAVGLAAPAPALELPTDPAALHIAYSRGISPGFLDGADHQTLVEGRFPRHRGLPLGRVTKLDRDLVYVDAAPRPAGRAPRAKGPAESAESADPAAAAAALVIPRAGMGVVFDRGRPEDHEEGGPIFAVDEIVRGAYRLRFGNPGPDLDRVRVGDFVWVTSDPRVTRAGEQAAEAGRAPLGRIAVELAVRGAPGQPLTVTARAGSRQAHGQTSSALQPARGAGLTPAVLADKLGAFGGTTFHLSSIDSDGLTAGLHVPVSELKELRRALVIQLDAEVAHVERDVSQGSVIEAVRASLPASEPGRQPIAAAPIVVPLCRTDAQLDAVIAAGAREVELDWMELVGLGKAVERARRAGLRVGVATVRVQKPGEQRIDAHLARLEPDHVLVRSWGSLAYLQALGKPPVLHGDFSLNVTNSITAGWVLGHGLASVTAAHDLDRDQLFAMLATSPRGRIGVTVHHHIPTFHTEHCVYAHLLSTGRDYKTCGRPCEQHAVALRDRVGHVHPVVVDVGCRNTVFNAQAQSAAGLVPDLIASGVQRLRVELVRETADQATAIFAAYTQLAAGT